mmetsp:Transcript_66923/g.81951  ORF Transcript_66923/g.81951 Transcript_66923/m.81951 type:complete len:127 (+) Transcript_66923:40-420(+)
MTFERTYIVNLLWDAILIFIGKEHKITRNINMDGYWGPVDSIVDWCEPNYYVTQYIAEFLNTLSSIPMVIFPLIGIYLCCKSGVFERRYYVLLFLESIIGIGSVIFHGTLRYNAQLFDEIPMMISS